LTGQDDAAGLGDVFGTVGDDDLVGEVFFLDHMLKRLRRAAQIAGTVVDDCNGFFCHGGVYRGLWENVEAVFIDIIKNMFYKLFIF
jgi:hypothetical protein